MKNSALPQNKGIEYWGNLAKKAVTDDDAFSELYDYFFPRIYQYLLSKTKDTHLADEVVSDTFIRMYQHLDDYDPARGAFSTWLWRIAQNALYKCYGRKSASMNVAWEENFDPVAPETETPERQMLSKEENEKIRRAMMQLTERQQKIVEMTYWLDMKSPEIAKILGIEPDTVRATLRQARAKLKKLLEN